MAATMKSIQINGNKLPTAEASLAGFAAPSAADSNYILIETKGPLEVEDNKALQEAQVKILEYKGNDVYLCGYKLADLSVVTDIPCVVDAVVYNPAYVVESDLKSDSGSDSEPTDVEIALHPDVAAADESKVASEIASATGLAASAMAIKDGKTKVTVPKSALAALAKIDAVKTINRAHPRKLFNNVACGIMDAHMPVGAADAVYKGAGQVVCVADTGFDTGSTTAHHAAFGDRVVALHALGRPAMTDDPDGHGTHVCGSVLGNGTHAEFGAVESPASQAKLIMQSLFSGWNKEGSTDPGDWEAGLQGIPDAYSDLFNPPFAEGARVHTNSWGGPVQGYQDANSGELDNYLWGNRKLTVLFAAGNAGRDVDRNKGHVDPSSLSAESVAKNVISVGASENLRPDVDYPTGKNMKYGVWRNDFKSAPIKDDPVANNPEGLAAFSSRGPTKPDGRIKPDVVAPGTTILSTRSSHILNGHFNPFWGISSDDKWCYEGGTSMATPLTAGCCAVIRGALVDNGTADPSAALVKAVLINGAVPLKGQYHQAAPDGEFGPDPDQERPNSDFGFGRVNLRNSLQSVVPGAAAAEVWGGAADVDGQAALAKDGVHPQTFAATVVVPQAAKPLTLKVTLVWADPRGEVLQNDLDLVVAGPGGAGERHGNMKAGDVAFDRVNNVEQVVWKNAPAGTYTITFKAFRITTGPQPFAYCWRVFAPDAAPAPAKFAQPRHSRW